jgi:hypothetical protein
MAARDLDFNPAGGYLKELKNHGLVRSKHPAAGGEAGTPHDKSATSEAGAPRSGGLPLARVLRSATSAPRSLDEIQVRSDVDEPSVLAAAISSLVDLQFVEHVDVDGAAGLKLTPLGEAAIDEAPDS